MSGAIVPFRSNGPAADQTTQQRFIQIGHVALHLQQQPEASGSGPNTHGSPCPDWLVDDNEDHLHHGLIQWPSAHDTASTTGAPTSDRDSGMTSSVTSSGINTTGQSHLANVGLVVWQSGLVLTDFLIRYPPLGHWDRSQHVMDLGTGTGIVGLALCQCGARVTFTDLPHILPLTRANITTNLPPGAPIAVQEYAWGTDASTLLQAAGGRPDIITGADLLYDPSLHQALLYSLVHLSAPHTVIFLSYRKRSKKEETFPAAAEAAGFSVQAIPDSFLAEEYQQSNYVMLRLAVRDVQKFPVAAEQLHQGFAVHVGGNAVSHMQDGTVDEGDEDLEHKPCLQS